MHIVPANIHKPPSSIVRLPYGSTSTVHCDARGLPAPNVKWIKESSSNSVPTVRLNNSAILELNHVTEDDAGIYYCLAFNTLVNPPKGRRNEADTWQIRVIIEGMVSTCTSAYQIVFIKALHKFLLVHVNIGLSTTQMSLSE